MKQGSFSISPGKIQKAYDRAVRKATREQVVNRIMKRQAAVYTDDRKLRKLIANRLGWVDSAVWMKRRVVGIEKFGDEVLKSGIRHVVLMGMGGSSLCPDLFRLVHRRHPKLKSFDVIDSTDPAAVKKISRKIDSKKSLFIVASKSGGTVETRSHEAYFQGLLKEARVRNIGRHFVAITDSGSGLHKSARRLKYRKVFLNPADIGGRFSALSYFGLVPGFFAGVDLRALLDDAIAMQKLLAEREGELNPAVALGAFMAAAAAEGRNKLTFVASRRATPLIPWIEQLVAESTGKKRKGVIPIEAEPIGKPDQYKDDRSFVFVRMVGERPSAADKLRQRVMKTRRPVVELTLGSKSELGRQFLLWEAATAVCGWLMRINPFDEPNVTESKRNTMSILGAFERSGEFPDQDAAGRWGPLSLVSYGGKRRIGTKELENLTRLLKRFFTSARRPEYLATLGFLSSDKKTEAALAEIRKLVRVKTGMATVRGYGPRYLHSSGQLHKGGPVQGRYLLFLKGHYGRLEIPGQVYDFGQLIAAQAIGDAQALLKRKLPVLVIAIDGSPSAGLEFFARALKRALR